MLVDRISPTNKSTDPADRLFRPIGGSVLGRQLTVEFIGTFILVLTVGLSTSTKAWFTFDQPSAQFGSFGIPAVTERI